MMFARSQHGAISVQVAALLPIFLTTVLFIFEFSRFFLVNVQLLQILEHVSRETKIAGYRTAEFDIQERARTLASTFGVQLIDPDLLSIETSWSDDLLTVAANSAPDGTGTGGDVVRYVLRYSHSLFGNFGERAWTPLSLEFVQISRNEPDW